MSIRTTEQLFDALSEELIWRKKELASLKSTIEGARPSPGHRNVMLRSGIALLYAHWEGFIKAASRAYLEFVASQRLRYEELSPNFIALSARSLLNQAAESSKARTHITLTEFFLNDLSKRSNIPYNNGIETKSNLSSEVLRNIVDTLGLDYTDYATKEKLLDEKLLHSRNTIAHGEYMLITLDEYRELHEFVIEMMNHFRTQVDNAASLKHYQVAS